MAHADWIIQVPDLRWCSHADSHANSDSDTNSDAYTNADANANANANANTDTYAYTNPDTCAAAGRTHESSWESGIFVSGQFVVDG